MAAWQHLPTHQTANLQRHYPLCATIRRRDAASQQLPRPWLRVPNPQDHRGGSLCPNCVVFCSKDNFIIHTQQ